MAEKNIMKIKEMAEASGLERNTIAYIYHNKTKALKLSTLNALCNALKCSPGDLFDYTPDKEN